MRFIPLVFALLSSFVAAKPLDDANAAFRLGEYAKAIELLTPLAEAGDVDALGNLGNMYAFGQGVEVNLDKAAELWRRAASKGLGTAMGNMAQLYAAGLGGLPRDPRLSAEWLQRAAEHRHAPSMLRLSTLYMVGDSVELSLVKAIAWAALAASNAPNSQVRSAAEQQARELLRAATAEERSAAQDLSNAFVKLIDANVARYKAQ